MALNDNAVLKPNTAHFYTHGTVGQAIPADLRKPENEGWSHMGHTSLEDILSASSEGGEQTVLPSLQNRQLRTARGTRTESFMVNLLQLDPNSAKLYFGSNAVIDAAGRVVSVPSDPQPSEVAWLCVMYDGTNDAGYHAPRAEVVRGEDLSISDTESLTQLPVRITPLSIGDSGLAYYFILPHAHIDGTAPTAVTLLTAGTPTATSVPLSWTAATDDTGVTGYQYRLNGGAWTATGSTNTSYTVTGLTASTAYTIDVRAVDAAGNAGAHDTVSVTTTA